jgi:hypothetical protein
MPWRFAQIADVHLNARLTGINYQLARAIRRTINEVFVECLRLADLEGCRVVLIPGDLYELKADGAREALQFFYDEAAKYPQIRFIVAPGNEDAYNDTCPYAYLKQPSNVFVFTEPEWQAIEVEDVMVVGRAYQVGRGVPSMDWSNLPPATTSEHSVLMIHGKLAGVDLEYRQAFEGTLVDPDKLLRTGYSYTALGHLHASAELQNGRGGIAAAYCGPPQRVDWDGRSPGGFLIGDFAPHGVELKYVQTARLSWEQRIIELPQLYTAEYEARLQAAFKRVNEDLHTSLLYQPIVRGPLAAKREPELKQRLSQAHDSVFFFDEPDLSMLHTTDEPEPADLPKESLLAQFLQRCASEEAQSNTDPQTYALVRRLGWQLLMGQGLPAEITE